VRRIEMLARLAIIMLVGALSAPGAVFSFSSNFDSGTNEGWNTLYSPGFNTVDPCNCTGLITAPVPATGGIGNSGFLEVDDRANGYTFVLAPSSWSGDLYGGNFSYYLRNTNPNNYVQRGVHLKEPAIRVAGTNGTILYYMNMPGANVDWTFNTMSFVEGPNWHLGTNLASPTPTALEVAQTLVDVASIGILMDWVSGYTGKPNQPYDSTDITGLDDVSLIGVPEPGTALLLAGGILSLLALRKRA
jgi:hypothetical protein